MEGRKGLFKARLINDYRLSAALVLSEFEELNPESDITPLIKPWPDMMIKQLNGLTRIPKVAPSQILFDEP